ncbi:NADH:flavin oxidoreductase [Aliidiomarina sedimenti]|uniref:NADH:flavin oxidoreductase n=1 Tax=Aliidiomarina sedimenti TaxID=1933879 RepID=A0ABY0BX62_9GAMM|nr:NADH:flavin oxidoreductase [Aliidiomarina sedimenti]RUO28777.1 NADH:flavin oxidoreductase [Aliidiomarina sedimenti]
MSEVFKHATLGNIELSNRLVVGPMTRISAEHEGEPTELMEDYYTRFADGGFDLIISEGVYTDRKASQGYQYQPGITDDSQQEGWANVVEKVHGAGAAFICQLMHAGAQMQYNRFYEHPKGVSEARPKGVPLSMYGKLEHWTKPETLDEGDINQIMNGFVGAAKRAKAAGFDGVELHAANGYLLNQFLSTEFNDRKDQWGGNLDNRMRFLLLLVKAVHDACGEDFVIGMRLSQITVTDHDYQWPEGEDGFRYLLEKLRDAGLAYVHTTDTAVNRKALKDSDKSLAQVASEVEGLSLIINGGITENNMEDLAEQYPDALLAVARKALVHQDLPLRLKDGLDIHELDPTMLEPKATLQHELNWRKINLSD